MNSDEAHALSDSLRVTLDAALQMEELVQEMAHIGVGRQAVKAALWVGITWGYESTTDIIDRVRRSLVEARLRGAL